MYVDTGHLLYADQAGTLWAVEFNVGRGEVVGEAVPVLDELSITRTQWARYSVSRNGTLMYETGNLPGGTQRQLVEVDLEGNENPIVLTPRNIQRVAWSPDGQSVVYPSEAQIYTYNVTLGTTPRPITFEGVNFNPVYSPDGSRVAYQSTREGTARSDLFVKNLNDDSPPRSIITLDGNQNPTQWPSDSLIVFESGEGGLGDLWTVNLSDRDNPRAEAYLEAEANLRRMVVSPDGTLAAYRSNESGQNEIYIRSFPKAGERTLVSESGGLVPLWSPDGNTLYYYTGSEQSVMAARLQRDPVPVVLSTDVLFNPAPHGEPSAGSALHPDGDRFILAQNAGTGDVEEGVADRRRFVLVTDWFEELRQRMGSN